MSHHSHHIMSAMERAEKLASPIYTKHETHRLASERPAQCDECSASELNMWQSACNDVATRIAELPLGRYGLPAYNTDMVSVEDIEFASSSDNMLLALTDPEDYLHYVLPLQLLTDFDVFVNRELAAETVSLTPERILVRNMLLNGWNDEHFVAVANLVNSRFETLRGMGYADCEDVEIYDIKATEDLGVIHKGLRMPDYLFEDQLNFVRQAARQYVCRECGHGELLHGAIEYDLDGNSLLSCVDGCECKANPNNL